MASASTQSANEPVKDFILVHTVQLKPMIKAQISGRMVSSGISDVALFSSEKNHLKKLMMMYYYYYYHYYYCCEEITVFSGRQKLTSANETEARKVMVDFKFDALEVIWKFVLVGLCVPTLYRECITILN